MRVLATLGYFDASGEGAILEIDLARGTQRTTIRQVIPEALRVAGKGFTGATWTGEPGRSDLIVCGFNALYRYSMPDLRHTGTLHQRCMNDLHHVACDGERLFVANTGLDSIDVLTLDGRFAGGYRWQPDWLTARHLQGDAPSRSAWPSLLEPGWAGEPPEIVPEKPDGRYYLESSPIKEPHRRVIRDFIHPNHIALIGDQVLVTRLLDHSVVDAATLRPVITDTPGHPHDGVCDGDVFWITCVNGVVAGYAIEGGRVTGRMIHSLDVFELTSCTGWCRGLLVTAEHLIVGLTEIRRMPRSRWCDRPFEGTKTAVLCLDKKSGRLVACVDVGERDRHPKLFGLLEAP